MTPLAQARNGSLVLDHQRIRNKLSHLSAPPSLRTADDCRHVCSQGGRCRRQLSGRGSRRERRPSQKQTSRYLHRRSSRGLRRSGCPCRTACAPRQTVSLAHRRSSCLLCTQIPSMQKSLTPGCRSLVPSSWRRWVSMNRAARRCRWRTSRW